MGPDAARPTVAPSSWALVVAVAALAAPVLVALGRVWLHLGRPLPLFALAAALAVAGWRLARPSPPLSWRPPLDAWLWFLGGLLLVYVGSRSGAWRLAGYGLAGLLPGALGLLRGERVVERVWPAAFLALLAVPHPNPPTYHAIAAGKSLVGEASAALLTLCGTPTVLDGWTLRAGDREVRMVDACSGARTQAGLLVVVAVLLCLRPVSRASRVAMLAACGPAALLASILRVTCVSAAYAHATDDGWPETVHAILGVGVIVPGVLLVLGAGWVTELFERERAGHFPEPDPSPGPLRRGRRPPRQIALALGLALCAIAAVHLPREAPSGSPPTLPARLGGLEGSPSPDAAALSRRLRPDRLELRQYGGRPDRLGTALLVHFQRLDAPNDLFTHATEVCHAVVGWTVLAEREVDAGGHRVRRLEVARAERRRVVHLAYLDADDQASPSLLGAWLGTIARGLGGRSTEGTLLVLSTGDLGSPDAGLREREARRMSALLEAVAGGTDS